MKTSRAADAIRGKALFIERTRAITMANLFMDERLKELKDMNSRNSKQNLISIGNETFDKFLGGGFLNTSLNLFERQGPTSKLLEAVWNKSLAASTLASGNNLILVNFNTLLEVERNQFISSLPTPRKVKSELLYKDIRGKSAAAKIKIAWRYSSRSSSPSDSMLRTDQVDFGLPLSNSSQELGTIRIINIKENFSMQNFFSTLEEYVDALQMQERSVNIIISSLLNPFSPMIDKPSSLCQFMFALRCFARNKLERGTILVSYDTDICLDHSQIKQQLYNIADSVVTFYSYETGLNKLAGYKNTDGTLDYVKVPKINSFGLHFQRELSDWGYRLTKNHRFFVVDELSLPPCDDDEEEKLKKQKATTITQVDHRSKTLEQVGPLEDFREVAGCVLAKQL